MQFVSKVAFFSLWCFVFSLPWDEVTSLPVLGSIPRIVGVVASAVGIVYILARRRIRQLSWFHVFAVLFVLWAGVGSFWSIDPAATRARFITYLQLVVLVWLIWEIAWSPERRRALLQAYVLGASVAGVTTVANYLAGVPVAPGVARFVALNQDPNYLGVILALGLPMAWYLSRSRLRGRLAWTWQLYIPLGVAAILLTASRGAFVAAVVALVIIPWTLGRLRLRTKVALSALALGSLVLAISFAPQASLERIGSTRADIAAGNFGGRGAIWMTGLEVARAHPLVGVGAGAFHAAVAPTLHREWRSHQTWLTIVVEHGIVGLLLVLAMVAAAMKPLRDLPRLERRFWIVLLATLAVGSLTLDWVNKKQLWFVLGVLAAQNAQRSVPTVASPAGRVRTSGREPGQERRTPVGARERAMPR